MLWGCGKSADVGANPSGTVETDETPAWQCPRCGARVTRTGAALTCEGCRARFPNHGDWIDFVPERAEARNARKRGFGPAIMQSRWLATIYERIWRPGFVIVSTRRIPDFEAEMRWIEQSLQPARDGLLLDLSCGPGVVGRRLAQRSRQGLGFEKVIGLDLSEPMLRRCAQLCRDEGVDNFPLVKADVSSIPLAGASVSGVHAGAGLHVWPDPEGAVSEVARVLRPGGRFVASTFVRTGRLHRRAMGRALELSSRVRMFDREELREICESHGLEDFEALVSGALILFSATRSDGSSSR